MEINSFKNYKISEETSEIDQEWINFIQEKAECSIYYHPAWLRALEEETNQKIIKLVCRDNTGKLVGIMPLQYTKGMPFNIGGIPAIKRISSLPRTPVGGLVASNDEVADILISKANEISKKNSKYRLQIKSFNGGLNERISALSKYYWREFYFTDISKYPEELRFGNSKNHTKIKWGVNKAIKNGIKIFCNGTIYISIR